MKPQLCLAVIDRCGSGIAARLAEIAEPCDIQDHADLTAALPELVDRPPDGLIVAQDRLSDADLALLRVLRHRAPRLRIVLAVPAEREVELEAAAHTLDARILRLPFDAADLAEAIALLAAPPGQAPPAGFLELTRGLSDEINNPLLFVQGHLQLLEALCEPARDADKLEQIAAIHRGLSRITATMEKLLLTSRARNLHSPLPSRSFATIWSAAVDGLHSGAADRVRELVGTAVPDAPLACDPGLLAAGLRHFVEVVLDLGGGKALQRLRVARDGRLLRIGATLEGLSIDRWQLPRTFEPYHLTRFLHAPSHGLNLFLAQTVVHAHGGSALARRLPEERIVLELALPVREPEPRPAERPVRPAE